MPNATESQGSPEGPPLARTCHSTGRPAEGCPCAWLRLQVCPRRFPSHPNAPRPRGMTPFGEEPEGLPAVRADLPGA